MQDNVSIATRVHAGLASLQMLQTTSNSSTRLVEVDCGVGGAIQPVRCSGAQADRCRAGQVRVRGEVWRLGFECQQSHPTLTTSALLCACSLRAQCLLLPPLSTKPCQRLRSPAHLQ